MKKILILILALMLAAVPRAFAAETVASGTCGDDLTWTVDDGGTLTISGTGAMDKEHYGAYPWDDYDSDITKIVVEEGVTVIPQYGLDSFDNLTTITLPSTVTDIHPQGLERTNVQAYVVAANNPNYCTVDGVLFNKSKTTLVAYPGGRDAKGSYTIPSTVTAVGNYAFDHSKLASVTIPGTVKSLGDYAFYMSLALKQATLQEGITTIGPHAFDFCFSLKSISIPASVSSIGRMAFTDCHGVESIDVADGSAYYCDVDNMLLTKDLRELLCIAAETQGRIIIPDGVETIQAEAANYCKKITAVCIPATVTKIENYAFAYCERLKVISFMGSAPSEIAANSFLNVTADVYYPEGDATWTEEMRQDYRGTLTWIPHIHDYIVANLKPTCTKDGFKKPRCVVCYHHYTIVLPATGHTEQTVKGYPATYSTAGMSDDVSCTTCGETLSEGKVIPRLELPFTDVPKNGYYYDSVCWALEGKITKGTSATKFSPLRACTRAEVVTFLWRAAGSPKPEVTKNPFVDVPANQYYNEALLWAVESGITNGVDETHFAPDRVCSRGEIVTLLWRAAGNPDPGTVEHSFSDVTESYYTQAMLWAVKEGVANGTSDTTFEPGTDCTRSQVVTFLCRWKS